MENQTFRSRLVELIQKSRKAMRLYTSMGRTFARPGESRTSGEFADAQANEWRGINADLVRRLSVFVESPNTKKLVSDVLNLRDQLQSDFRAAESELHSKQRELIFAAENSDFIKAAVLSRELVLLKARVQATQAAHHELDAVVSKSKLSGHSIELSDDKVVGAEHVKEQHRNQGSSEPQRAKVIQLRKVGRE